MCFLKQDLGKRNFQINKGGRRQTQKLGGGAERAFPPQRQKQILPESFAFPPEKGGWKGGELQPVFLTLCPSCMKETAPGDVFLEMR